MEETHSFHFSLRDSWCEGEGKKVKRELFASSRKSLFYVIAIQEHLKPSSKKKHWQKGKWRTKPFGKWAIFDIENTSHIPKTQALRGGWTKKKFEFQIHWNKKELRIVSIVWDLWTRQKTRGGEFMRRSLIHDDECRRKKFVYIETKKSFIRSRNGNNFSQTFKKSQLKAEIWALELLISRKTIFFRHHRTLNPAENNIFTELWQEKSCLITPERRRVIQKWCLRQTINEMRGAIHNWCRRTSAT